MGSSSQITERLNASEPMNEVRLDQLRTRIGEEMVVSEWLTIGQDRIDRFAQTTGDDQWLHVDIPRAKLESPYGSTVAHGFLTLSLIGSLMRGVLSVQGVQMTVNYGLDRVRFTAPVPAAARIRGRFTVKSVEPYRDAIKVVWHVVVERDVDEKACCIADWVVLYYPAK